ncbi:flagellar hook-basal body complex protein [Acetobacter persici]|uniref:Flagellar hook protein FlgE n=1 Tax=Acetobacter persici TaxID=1076596 RepID=A0A1U9LIV9_9PROT|nr:flagellar hook-basal body complex protein [Acetobacter persici]AQT06362.1 flagellar biosynthesis protein FlgE [Acetobacter persici]
MSGVFNALQTAVSGISAQSDAFTNLGNNIANSQTVGYKADSTAFQDFVSGNLSGTSESQADADSVAAVTVQHVDNEGTATASTDSLAMAISGAGLFNVSKPISATNASTTTNFSTQQYYTRNGEFYENKSGYLVNTSGYYLDGYTVDSSGSLGNKLTPINVSDITFKPTQTTKLTLSATVGKLPTDTTSAESYTPQSYTTAPVTTYDALSNPHKVAASWTQSSTNPLVWNVSAYDADGTGTIAPNNYQVTFDSSGDLASVVDSSTGKTVGSTISGASVAIPITANYGDNRTQTMALDLGTIGGTSGTTMATSNQTVSTSQASALTVSGTTLTMPAGTQIGTTTGSNQSYMTTPVEIGGTPVAEKWTQTSSSPATWSVQTINPYDASSSAVSSPTHSVVFNTDGSVKTFDGAAPSSPLTATATVNGTAYTVDLSGASLSTNYALDQDTTSLTTDSVTSGNYEGVSIESDGSIQAQFDNGYTQLIGKVALTTFHDENGLHAVDGQAYLATSKSGDPETGVVGENGTGTLSVGYTESSTTDLTSDLSALIVTQEAYTANTKIVTTADTLLQTTIGMKQ